MTNIEIQEAVRLARADIQDAGLHTNDKVADAILTVGALVYSQLAQVAQALRCIDAALVDIAAQVG